MALQKVTRGLLILSLMVSTAFAADVPEVVFSATDSNYDSSNTKIYTDLAGNMWFTDSSNLTAVSLSDLLSMSGSGSASDITETVTGLSYNNGTYVLSETAGYSIPTDVQIANWESAVWSESVSGLEIGSNALSVTSGFYGIPTDADEADWDEAYDEAVTNATANLAQPTIEDYLLRNSVHGVLSPTWTTTVYSPNVREVRVAVTPGNPTILTWPGPHYSWTGATHAITNSNTTPSIDGNQTITVTGANTATIAVSTSAGSQADASQQSDTALRVQGSSPNVVWLDDADSNATTDVDWSSEIFTWRAGTSHDSFMIWYADDDDADFGRVAILDSLQIGSLATPVAYSRFGTGTTGHSLNSEDDLLVSGTSEFDGASYFDSSLTAAGYITSYLLFTFSNTLGEVVTIAGGESARQEPVMQADMQVSESFGIKMPWSGSVVFISATIESGTIDVGTPSDIRVGVTLNNSGTVDQDTSPERYASFGSSVSSDENAMTSIGRGVETFAANDVLYPSVAITGSPADQVTFGDIVMVVGVIFDN